MGFFKDVDKSSNDDVLAESDSKIEEALSIFDEVDDKSDEYKSIDEETLASLDSVDDSEIEAMLAANVSMDIPIDIDVDLDSVNSEDMVNTIDEPEPSDSIPSDESLAEEPIVEPVEEYVVDQAVVEEPVNVNASASDDNSISETEVTVITKGTTIKGGISSDCSLEVMGVIAGDVECQGKLSIYGTVSGNAEASEIYVNTPVKLVGDLKSSGCIKVSENSVIVGTITGASAFVAGSVKGDIEVEGPVVVDSSAVVLGNITAKSLQLNNGAMVEGICTVGSRGTNINSIFE